MFATYVVSANEYTYRKQNATQISPFPWRKRKKKDLPIIIRIETSILENQNVISTW